MLSFDIPLFLALNATPSTPAALAELALWLSQDLPTFLGLLLVLEFARGGPAGRRAVLMGLVALLAAWCAVRGLRELAYFPRPTQLGLGMQWIDQGPRSRLPSMHAATAFALAHALVLQLPAGRCRAWRCLAYGLALAVGWSRLCLGVHLPSDILAGAVVGLGCAGLVHRVPRGYSWIKSAFRAYPSSADSYQNMSNPAPGRT